MKEYVIGALIGFAAVFAFLFVGEVHADNLDELKASGKQAVCTMYTERAIVGAEVRLRGGPLKFIYTHEAPVATEPPLGIFIFDGLTENEKRFVEDAAAEGWQTMDELLAKGGRTSKQAFGDRIYQACLSRENA